MSLTLTILGNLWVILILNWGRGVEFGFIGIQFDINKFPEKSKVNLKKL